MPTAKAAVGPGMSSEQLPAPGHAVQVGVVLMKLVTDSCRIDVRAPGGGYKSVPAFWHKLELGHDGSARGG